MTLTLAVLEVTNTGSICYESMIQVFIEVRITYLSQHNQLLAVLLCLWRLSHLLPSVKDKISLSLK